MRIVMIAFTNIEYTIELSEAIAELEDLTLMIPAQQAQRFASVIKHDMKLHAFEYPRLRSLRNIFMTCGIMKKIGQIKPDIIHIQKGHPWFNLSLAFLKRYCLVTTIHDVILLDWPSQRIPEITYRPPIKNADQLIVHGDKLKAAMMEKYGRSKDEIHVLPRGVNSIYTRYHHGAGEEEAHTVLYFGRIWEYKGLRYLIEAEPLISECVPDVKIVIAGSGEDFGKYRKMMVHPDKFIVHNEHIPNEKVGELFEKSSVVVLPYTDGSQSGVIPQAYAFRKPVVITDVGSLPENVQQGVTGFIVPPGDAFRLAEAITDLLLDDAKRREMGNNAYRKTKEELSWRNIAPRTVEVYKKALSLRAVTAAT